MLKKIVIALLAAISAVTISGNILAGNAALYTETDEKVCGTITLTRKIYRELYLPRTGDVSIPEYVTYKGETYKVNGIGQFLFHQNRSLTNITLPDSIQSIGPFAFDLCKNLETCNLPDGLLQIGYSAFQCCYKLQDLEFPDSVQSIGNFAYNHCSNLGNQSINLPASLKCLGEKPQYPAHMFYDCGQKESLTAFTVDAGNTEYMAQDDILYTKNGETLVSIPVGKVFKDQTYVMPDTVKNLGELSFGRNDTIHKVAISDSLQVDGKQTDGERHAYLNIGNDLSVACYAYGSVEEYLVKESNPTYISIDGILYSKDQKHVVAIPNHYKGIIHIPDGTEVWDKEALWSELPYFEGQIFDQISEIHLPASLKEIHEVQVDIINRMVELYGTEIIVAEGNSCFSVDESSYLTVL